MRIKIIPSYKRQSDNNLLDTSYCVVEKMEGNPNFPTPPAALAELKKLLPQFQTAVNNAVGGDREMISVKNDQKAIMVALLTRLAEYVTLTCNGDRSLLLSSGFEISGEKGNQPNPVIEKLLVELGAPGVVTTRIKRVRGARAYMHQYTTEPPSSTTVWISEGSSFSYYTFKGLQSAVKYWLRIVAIGPGGQVVYSPVISCIVQ